MMKTHVPYRDIPVKERKELGAEVYRRSPGLKILLFVVVLGSVLGTKLVLDHVWPQKGFSLARSATAVGGAVILFTIIWEIFGRRRLRAEVETLKNS